KRTNEGSGFPEAPGSAGLAPAGARGRTMTQRNRKAPSGVLARAAPAPAVVEPPRAGPAPPAGTGQTWEDLFRHASPSQQQELLELARRQGLIYAHQLPVLTNGSKTALAGNHDSWNCLNKLLGGRTDHLSPAS